MNAEKPRAKPGMKCPLWRKDMSKVCHTCEWWVKLHGKHPQSEEIIDNWGCSISFLPILMVENSQMQRQTGASTDKVASEINQFHNNMLRSNDVTLSALNEARRLALLHKE